MEEITVNIGEFVTNNSGIEHDTRQAVQFTGEELGTYRAYGTDREGGVTDTRGTVQTLYRVDDGRLALHEHEWSRWMGEPDTESLIVITETDLQPTGAYARLGAACGFGRALTLDEAIGPRMVPDRPGAMVEVGEFEDVPEITLTVRLGVSDLELSDAISDFNHALCDYGVHLDGEETPLGRLRLALLKVRRDED